MGSPIAELQQRAVDYARSANFGQQALDTNLELTRAAPSNEGAWTRLARCYMESGQLDDALGALDSALRLNPQNTIARSLQAEVVKRRTAATTMAPPPRRRGGATTREPRKTGSAVTGGFGRPEFAALGQLAPSAAADALAPRIESLLMALNDRPFAAKAVDTRNRAGRSGARLFRRNSFYPGSPGHVFAFHHGGRWEPQLNLGFYAASAFGRDCLRAGIGFNLSQDGSDPEREAGQERIVAHFEHFQRLVASEWRQLLTVWMATNAGFIQHGTNPPSLDLMPADAVSWLINCHNPVEAGWVFCGRWLFADRPHDAETLADGRRLTTCLERTFSDLQPLWTTLFRE